MANPGDDTALIIPVHLPRPLEALRRYAVVEARKGLPAHVTLLYPFAPHEALDGDLRALLAGALADVAAFAFELRSQGRWPEVLFATVEPDLPFRSLHRRLAAAFPGYPIYGGRFDFVPHVTVVEGPMAAGPEITEDPAWGALPAGRIARSAALVVRDGDVWKVRWRFRFQRVDRSG